MLVHIVRYAYLDAVRGYAILMVIAVHTLQTFGEIPALLDKLVEQGQRGVQLFFVASALALCFSWTVRNDGAGPFYVRRLFRIAPMFWLAIGFFVWMYGTGPRLFAPDGIDVRHILMTAVFIQGFWPDTISSVVPGGWSVADEAIFYAMFPFLVPVLLRSSWRTILIVLAVAIIAGAQASRVLDAFSHELFPKPAAEVSRFYFFYWFPRQLPCFLFGIMLFKWQAERPLPAPAVGALLCLVSIISMVVVPFLEGVKYALPLGPQTTYGLVFTLFVFSLMAWKSSPLVNPVVIWIGKVSYSAYFIHFAVLYYLAVPHLSGNATFDFAITYALTVTITVAFSFVTYWLVEQPSIRLGSQVISRMSSAGPGIRVG